MRLSGKFDFQFSFFGLPLLISIFKQKTLLISDSVVMKYVSCGDFRGSAIAKIVGVNAKTLPQYEGEENQTASSWPTSSNHNVI